MEKTYEVTGSKGDLYHTTIGTDDTGRMYTVCTCKAGMTKTLCKHVIGIIASDDAYMDLLGKQSFYNDYKRYLELTAEADKLKREAAALKKRFSQELIQVRPRP